MTDPIIKKPVPIHTVGTSALIEELWQRGDLDLALKEFERRSVARAALRKPRWWDRFGWDRY